MYSCKYDVSSLFKDFFYMSIAIETRMEASIVYTFKYIQTLFTHTCVPLGICVSLGIHL